MRPPYNPPVTGKAAEALINDIRKGPSETEKKRIEKATKTEFPL
jgi:hypothetical protein